MARLTQIEGIGPVYAATLKAAGFHTQDQLLAAGATRAGRRLLAHQTGISPTRLLDWINRADLARVKGIGEEFADLLEHAGVDTVPELARRNPANLHATLTRINDKKKLTRTLPPLSKLQRWIARAGELTRAIFY